MTFDLPSSLKALQIARHMMSFDPYWTESILEAQKRVAQWIAEYGNQPDQWFPIQVTSLSSPVSAAPTGFIYCDRQGLSGQYRRTLSASESIAAIDPIVIHPTPPLTLQNQLLKELESWKASEPQAEQATLYCALQPLSSENHAFSIHPLRSLSLFLLEHPASTLEAIRIKAEEVLTQTTQQFVQLAISGKEMALTLAIIILIQSAIESVAYQHHTHQKIHQLLQKHLLINHVYSLEILLDQLLKALIKEELTAAILHCVQQFETYTNEAFEKAKAANLSDLDNEDELAQRVLHDIGCALETWNVMHQTLHAMMPMAYASQLLSRALLTDAPLPDAQKTVLAFTEKQMDETVVIIMTSLSHAVAMHHPNRRQAVITQIQQAREEKGESGAKAVIRTLVEQQAFYPRCWKTWLNEAARSLAI